MDLQLKGKTALVAASSQGLGLAIAKGLLEEGANVIISGREEAKLNVVTRQLKGPGKIAYKQADITRPDQIKKLVNEAVERFGGIDILVKNAGGPPAQDRDCRFDKDSFAGAGAIQYSNQYCCSRKDCH